MRILPVLSLCLALGLSFSACTEAKKKIVGTIELPAELQKSIKPEAVLYVIARPAGQTAGPPIAVKRFTQPIYFPLEFNLSAQDVMLADTPFEGKFSVSARISQNGSASPARPGDILGASPDSVSVGGKDVKIMLNQVR